MVIRIASHCGDHNATLEPQVAEKVVRAGNNYEDSRCVWGYITLCNQCTLEVKQDPGAYRNINPNKEVQGFPLAKCCEVCGMRVKFSDS